MRVILMSNITMLSEEVLKKLADMYISEFYVSLYSMNPDIHDKITGQCGSWNKTIRALDLIQKYGIPVKIKTPLMIDNAFSYKDIYFFCQKNGYAFLTSPVIFAKSDGNKETLKLRIQKEDLKIIVRELDKIVPSNRKRNVNKPEACPTLRYSFSIDAKGDVFPCNSIYVCVGNVKKEKLRNIWYNSELLLKIQKMEKKDLEQCVNCGMKEVCDRCPGLALLEDNNIYGCSSIAREIAVVRSDEK